jgi:hypothetical protein
MNGTAVVPLIGKAVTMMRMITILAVAASLTACASPEVWHKSGATQQDVDATTGACQSVAQHIRASSNAVYGGLTSYNYFNNCMVDHGYQVSMF